MTRKFPIAVAAAAAAATVLALAALASRRVDRVVVRPAYATVPAKPMTGAQMSPQTSSPIASNAAGLWNHSGVATWQNAGPTQSPLVNGTASATGDVPYSTNGGAAVSWLTDVAAGAPMVSGGVAAAPVYNPMTIPSACTTGDTFICSGTNAQGRVADVATGSVWASGGVGVAPGWSGLPLLTAPNGSTEQGHGMIVIYSDAVTTQSSSSVTVTDSKTLSAHTLGANGQRLHVYAQYAHTSGNGTNNCQNNVTFNGTITGSISGAVASEAYGIDVVYKRLSSSTIQWSSHAHANASVADNGGTLTGLNLDTTAYAVATNMLATTATGDCTFAGLDIDLLTN